MWEKIVAINSVLKRKKLQNYIVNQLNMRNSTKTLLKKIHKKNMWGNTVARQKSCGETL
jgi:hypothetical protein